MSEEVALMTQGLTKSYGRVRALRGVDLEVRRGEIFGYLGPNGAGKGDAVAEYPSAWLGYTEAGDSCSARAWPKRVLWTSPDEPSPTRVSRGVSRRCGRPSAWPVAVPKTTRPATGSRRLGFSAALLGG